MRSNDDIVPLKILKVPLDIRVNTMTYVGMGEWVNKDIQLHATWMGTPKLFRLFLIMSIQ